MLCIRSWLALLMSRYTPRIQSVNADEHCHLEPTPGLVRVERHALSCRNTASFGFLCFSRESVNPRGICPTFSFSLRSRQMAENVADNGRAASPLPPRGDYGDEQAGRLARSTVRSTLNRHESSPVTTTCGSCGCVCRRHMMLPLLYWTWTQPVLALTAA